MPLRQWGAVEAIDRGRPFNNLIQDNIDSSPPYRNILFMKLRSVRMIRASKVVLDSVAPIVILDVLYGR